MAKEKGSGEKRGLGKTQALLQSLLARLPFFQARFADGLKEAPEPFSSVEDETPLGDLLESSNAAVVSNQSATKASTRNLGETFKLLLKKPLVLVILLSGLSLILLIVIVSIAVNTPPETAKASQPFSPEGLAAVKSWLTPPGDPLAPRMEMERSDTARYTQTDAEALGLPKDSKVLDSLKERNDQAIDDLYGTVP